MRVPGPVATRSSRRTPWEVCVETKAVPDSRTSKQWHPGSLCSHGLGGTLSSHQPCDCLFRDPPVWSPAPGQALAGAESEGGHVEPHQKEEAVTHHLPCFSPQDLHHLGHQQLVPPRAGPSGPGGPRRSPARRQPQPVPQRHFNGNRRLGSQKREMRAWGRVWRSDMGSGPVPGHCQAREQVQG